MATTKMIGELRDNDVICGRNKIIFAHPGNIAFRQAIREEGVAYQATNTRDAKKQITMKVIAQVKADHGRFVMFSNKKPASEWSEVDFEYIYEKVSHALRSAHTADLPSKKPTNSTCNKTTKSEAKKPKKTAKKTSKKKTSSTRKKQGSLSTNRNTRYRTAYQRNAVQLFREQLGFDPQSKTDVKKSEIPSSTSLPKKTTIVCFDNLTTLQPARPEATKSMGCFNLIQDEDTCPISPATSISSSDFDDLHEDFTEVNSQFDDSSFVTPEPEGDELDQFMFHQDSTALPFNDLGSMWTFSIQDDWMNNEIAV